MNKHELEARSLDKKMDGAGFLYLSLVTALILHGLAILGLIILFGLSCIDCAASFSYSWKTYLVAISVVVAPFSILAIWAFLKKKTATVFLCGTGPWFLYVIWMSYGPLIFGHHR